MWNPTSISENTLSFPFRFPHACVSVVQHDILKLSLKGQEQQIHCLEVHLVFGLLTGNSIVATNTHDIDMSGPPTSHSQEVPELNSHILKRKRSKFKIESRLNSSETKNKKNSFFHHILIYKS